MNDAGNATNCGRESATADSNAKLSQSCAALTTHRALQGKSNIVKMVGYTESPNTIVMRLYNTSLYSFLFHNTNEGDKKSFINPALAFGIALDVATGLRNLHFDEIVHFDLKPQNVLLDAQMRAYICDFGYATLCGRQRRLVSGIARPKAVS